MNQATRKIVAVLGVMLGIAGFNHGFFEAMQGNTPTDSLIIQAIGDAQRMWLYGTEEALTIVPNFLLTGILSMLVSLIIMIWSIGFVHREHGPSIFILLFSLLFLVGGGIGQVVFFVPTWLASTRIHKPLDGWRRVLPENVRRVLGKLWPYSLSVTVICFLIALGIAIFGFAPRATDPDSVLVICWSFLGAAWVLMLFTLVCGFAYDIQRQTDNKED